MNIFVITPAYFDGQRHHAEGPYTIEIAEGRIIAIHGGPNGHNPAAPGQVWNAGYVMPGLVEAHCHLFLDGAELDVEARKNYLKAPVPQMLEVARRNLQASADAGITLVRDAGDAYGVNFSIRQEQQAAQAGTAGAPSSIPGVRCPGRAIRKAGRYGSFMAIEVTDRASIEAAIRAQAGRADDLKILLTGIIDFEKGCMKGGVQFDLEEIRLIQKLAREVGLKTYAHCSGPEGLAIAAQAGLDSIEHGFFMTREILKVMRDKGIAWVPTFSPVYFQFARPELAGWNPATVARLGDILKNHFEHVALAAEWGVPVVAGSDAGSYGVPHGTALIDELFFQQRAGMSVEQVLASATSVPRRAWNCAPAEIRCGAEADLIVLEGSPVQNLENLRRVQGCIRGASIHRPAPALQPQTIGTSV